MSTAIIRKHQCLLDVAAQHCGDITAAFDIALLNGISITDQPAPGTELELPQVIGKREKRFYDERGVEPVTIDEGELAVQGGIGFMGIGIDFKIS